MRTIFATVGPLASASANAICLSQTPGGAVDLTLNGALVSGGVATMDKPRRVLVTCAGNETGKTITVYGTDWNGNPVSEALAGPNATTVQSLYDYATVTRIAVSAAFAGAATVGTSAVASSRPIFLDGWAAAQVALQADVTGTANATVQQTLDDLQAGYTAATWLDHPDSNLVALTASKQGNYGYAPQAVRITLNSGTGSVALAVTQFQGPLR